MIKLNVTSVLWFFAFGVLGPSSASARVFVSIDIEQSWTDATHVIVADEGSEVDGNVTVTESWKGTLQPGENIAIPELANFGGLPIYDHHTDIVWKSIPNYEKKEASTKITSRKILLFLDRDGDRFLPAGGKRFSQVVAWIEDDHVLAFRQILNPGPAVLFPVMPTRALGAIRTRREAKSE